MLGEIVKWRNLGPTLKGLTVQVGDRLDFHVKNETERSGHLSHSEKYA